MSSTVAAAFTINTLMTTEKVIQRSETHRPRKKRVIDEGISMYHAGIKGKGNPTLINCIKYWWMSSIVNS
jgi:hypothetical protein